MNRYVERLGVYPYLLGGLALFALGLLALRHVVDNFWPIDVERIDLIRATALDQADAPGLLAAVNGEVLIAFLGSVVVAVTGLVLPLLFYLNRRFGKGPIPHYLVILRQSMWVGLWVAFCVWLQMNRTLGWAVILLVGAVLAMFEFLLQIRTRADRLAATPDKNESRSDAVAG
jgi:hypothetical protein